MGLFLTDKLKEWLNVPAVLHSDNHIPAGEIQYGVKVSDIKGISKVIQTKRRGIPLQWLREESRRHYKGYIGADMDNDSQKRRTYNNLSSDYKVPRFWFVKNNNSKQMPIRILTAHMNRNEDKVYGIASENNGSHGLGLFGGQRFFLYTIKKTERGFTLDR